MEWVALLLGRGLVQLSNGGAFFVRLIVQGGDCISVLCVDLSVCGVVVCWVAALVCDSLLFMGDCWCGWIQGW